MATMFFPVLACLFTLPFILIQYHKYGAIHKGRSFLIYSFILYLLVVYFLVILPLPTREEVLQLTTPRARFIPFAFVFDFLNETSLIIGDPTTYLKALTEPCVYIVIFNILMTVPFGMYLRYYFKKDFKQTLLLSFFLSLFFELTQLSGLYFIYPRGYRLFDIDDLMLNTLGGIIGYWAVGFFLKYLPSRDAIDQKTYELGEKVSGLRRIMCYSCDLFTYFLICIIFSIFFSNSWYKYVLFFMYYIFIPFFQQNQTPWQKFLKVRITSASCIWLFMRPFFLYFYYIKLPGLFLQSILLLKNFIIYPQFLFLIAFIIILIFYLMHFFTLIIKHHLYYDQFFKTKYLSTALENK